MSGAPRYYQLASNFHKLNYFAYLMEYSCLKTLAARHKCTMAKIRKMFKDGHGKWGIPYETKHGMKRMHFSKYSECKNKNKMCDTIPNLTTAHLYAVTTFESRLKAKVCELCGTTESQCYEIHHVNKLKNLKGKELWERVMLAKRRKTIVVCHECHLKIHNRSSKTPLMAETM